MTLFTSGFLIANMELSMGLLSLDTAWDLLSSASFRLATSTLRIFPLIQPGIKSANE